MTKNNKKEFDCIAMKSSIQKQIYSETKNMTVNELLYYFNGNEPSIQERIAAAERLAGIASKNPMPLEEIRNERLTRQ